MSWSATKRGTTEEVTTHVVEAIKTSASYDTTLSDKAHGIAEGTKQLIEAAASDAPDGKEISVTSYGHLHRQGVSSYGLTVCFMDPEPEHTDADAQFAAATGTTGETSGE